MSHSLDWQNISGQMGPNVVKAVEQGGGGQECKLIQIFWEQ